MTRVETIKAVRAFLEANKLNTEAVSNDNGLTHYFFTINVETIDKSLDVMFSIGDEGDFTSIVFVDLKNELTDNSEIYALTNWLNLENSDFRGAIAYVSEDNAIAVMKSVDSYFHKEVFGEEISYLVKMQIDLVKDYYDVIDDVTSGKSLAEAVTSFESKKEKH